MSGKLLGLHGFLGSPDDFAHYEAEFDLITPNLDDLVHLNLAQIGEKILTKKLDIIGYSFGGRLAARLKLKFPEKVGKVLIISSHMGYQVCPSARKKFEADMITKIENSEQAEFLNFWNSIDLFKADSSTCFMGDYQKASLYFSNYGLSAQPYLIDRLKAVGSELKFIFGKQDSRYLQYADSEIRPNFAVEYIEGGHRCLQNFPAVSAIMREFF